ncbi:MAG: hypothetical protein P8P70_03475 [Sulfitobacter sp.]|nr:hypothetical protein [Sulfitobacter sp.]
MYGRIGDDTISATSSEGGLSGNIYGNDGDDVLRAYDSDQARGGVLLDGGDHDDIITSSANMTLRTVDTEQDTLTGGRHDDAFIIDLQFPEGEIPEGRIDIATITDFNRGENTLTIHSGANDASGVAFDGLELNVAEDGSYTEVIARYNSLTEGTDPTLAVIRLEGVRNLKLSDINLTTGDVTTSGDDYISSGGGLGDATATMSGGAGDDLLMHEGRDDAGALVMEGGVGNDTLIADEIEFSNATTLDGGAGDDLLVTQLFSPASADSVDTFISGAGADVVEISTVFDGLTGDNDYGLTARVTDFTPGEDMMVIDTSPISDGLPDTFTQSVTLTENTEGNYTDVRFVVTNTGNASTFSGVVRLEGLTGLSEDDIGVSLSDSSDRLSDVPVYQWTETSEVRT